jgi:hypothetical protein
MVWRFEHDVLARRSRHIFDHGSTYDLELGGSATERYWGYNTVSIEDPGDASAEGNADFELRWSDATVQATAHTSVVSDQENYRVRIELDVREGGAPLWSRTWERTVARRLQ